MKKLPPISEYFTPERAMQEEVNWILSKNWEPRIEFLLPLIEKHDIQEVVELGCHTGLLASRLPKAIVDYLGIDNNPWFLAKSKQRNPDKKFVLDDPSINGACNYDLVMAWDYFKHISLDEWSDVLIRMTKCGKFCAFNAQVIDDEHEEIDDGEQYHHSFVHLSGIKAAARARGYDVEESKVVREWTLGSGAKASDVLFWLSPGTEKVTVNPEVGRTELLVGETLEEARDLDNFSLTWVKDDGCFRPILYYKGILFLKNWKLRIEAEGNPDMED